MHNKTKLLIFASLLLAACSTDPMQEIPNRGDSAPEIETSDKICNTSDDAVAGSLIVKFGEEAIPSLEQNALNAAKTRSALTRSGIESVDDILNDLHVTSLERVFPEAGEHEARTRAAGLHRWYVLGFASEEDLDKAAERLAGVAEISKVQFRTRLYRASDCKTYPFQATANGQTRALVTADFNDPNLFWQWHYINNADQAVATTSVAGLTDWIAEQSWEPKQTDFFFFLYPVRMTFLSGPQSDEFFTISYGPRLMGFNSFDLNIKDPSQPKEILRFYQIGETAKFKLRQFSAALGHQV
jgi:hypothetical protein